MKYITSFRNLDEALSDLDNGGWFYHFFSRANDGILTTAELQASAGPFSDRRQAILFFEAATTHMDIADKQALVGKMDARLRTEYDRHRPERYTPAQALASDATDTNAIITGVPRRVGSESAFKAMVMIPVLVGQVTTFMIVPIADHYDVYELSDERSSDVFIIAHTRGAAKLPERSVSVAGILRDLNDEKQQVTGRFLDVAYFLDPA